MKSFFVKGLWVWGLMLQCAVAMGQETDRWSAPRNIVPPNIEAREARLVILSDGSLNVTFRGADIESPEIGGIFFTKSTDQGYSWSKPEPVISVPGIQSVTHQIESEGNTLLLFVTVFRPPNFEIVQFVSPNGGRSWSETDTLFAETEPVRSMHSWQVGGRLFLLVVTERVRTGNESEYSFYIVRGRGSGAYWDPPVKTHNVYASSITHAQLVDNGPDRMASLYFRQNGFEDHLLENTAEDYATWRDRPVTSPPQGREFRQRDQGIAYRVEATPGRQILFNRTDNQSPQTKLITPIPSAISKPTLKIVWEGSDNYTLPDALRYELQMDEQPAFIVSDATNHQFDSLLNGQHRLTIVAIDEAENRQVPPSVEGFEVKVLPQPAFIYPRNGDLLNSGDLTASWQGVHNSAPDSKLEYSLKVDEQEWTEYSNIESMEITGLQDGEHALFLRARDVLGNISEDGVSVRFEVDSTPPTSMVEELPRDWESRDVPWPGLPDFEVEFRVQGRDNRTPAEDLEYRYRLGEQLASEWLPVTEPTVITGLDDGTHTISFETRDEAQNVQEQPTLLQFEFNTYPNTRVWLDETRQPATYRFAGKDSNSDAREMTYRWRVDEGSWSEWSETGEVSLPEVREGVAHGEHSLQVQGRDAAGNVDPSPADMVIEVDNLPPTPPTSLTVASRDDGAVIELSWEPVGEPSVRYNVYRSREETTDKANAELIVQAIQRTRSSDTPRREEHTVTYYYFVTALDLAENESDPSPVEAVDVLGEVEIREKVFQEFSSRIDDLIRTESWAQISQQLSSMPETPPGKEAYPSYWTAIAQAGAALKSEPPDVRGLTNSREKLEDFMASHPDFPQIGEVDRLAGEVKTQLFWSQLSTYGMYGGVLLIVLLLLGFVYKWMQNRKVTVMPTITITEGTEDITPSKEALKDPTVLRRWAEVQADSSSAENWGRLAFAFHNIGEVDNAIQSLYKALEIDPNNPRYHFQMGHFQKEGDNTREAIKHFERYLQLNPESKKSAEEVKELLAKLREQVKG